MAAPFALSSSAGYAFMGKDNGWLVPKSEAAPGDILIYDRYGNAYASNGSRGHTGILIAKLPDGRWLTLESRGGEGVCFIARFPTFWTDVVVRVPGTSPARVQKMIEWGRTFDWVGYYAGAGDNDHDGQQDRADTDDGNGIDCSGAVYLAFEFAWRIPEAGDPPPITPEQLETLRRALEELDVEHGMAVGSACAAGDRIVQLDRHGGLHVSNGVQIEATAYWPGLDVARNVLLRGPHMKGGALRASCIFDPTVPLSGWVQDHLGGWHPWREIAAPGAPAVPMPPRPKNLAYWPSGKSVPFTEY